MKRLRNLFGPCKRCWILGCRRKVISRYICPIWCRKYIYFIEDIIFRIAEFGINKGMRVLGPILVCGALVLISCVVYSYFTEIFPYLLYINELNQYPYLYPSFITLIGIYLLINILFNHQSCIWIGPGFSPKTTTNNIINHYKCDPELKPSKPIRYCNACDAYKPWRAHHCSICAKCVLKMDHHCPWMWNCVGYKNYGYFVMFLFYLFLGTLYYLIVGYSRLKSMYTIINCSYNYMPFFLCNTIKKHINYKDYDNTKFNDASELLTFTYFLCIGINIVMSGFLGFHLYLLFTNQSTLESIISFSNSKYLRYQALKNKSKFYDLKNIKLNIIQVFGDKWYWKCFVPVFRKPKGNGLIYPLRNDIKNIVYATQPNIVRTVDIL